MSETVLTTEETIRNAAQKIFKQKGFDGTSVQDIATEAGTTKSMVNYYFRTKEKLFAEIFHNEYRNLFSGIGFFITADLTLREKIEKIVEFDIDKLSEIPDLPIFILTELHHNPEIVFKTIESLPILMVLNGLNNQIAEEVAKGTIRMIAARDLIINIQSLTIFPFLGRPMMMKIFGLDEAGFNAMLQQRKKEIPEIIWSSIKI